MEAPRTFFGRLGAWKLPAVGLRECILPRFGPPRSLDEEVPKLVLIDSLSWVEKPPRGVLK